MPGARADRRFGPSWSGGGADVGRTVPRPDRGSQQRRIGHLEHPLVGEDGDVGQAHGGHGAVELASEGARSNPDAVADGKGSGHQEHQPGEDVAQALLGRDADDDTGDGAAEEQVADGDRQHGEHADERDRVAETRHQHAHGGTRGLAAAPAGQVVELHRAGAGTRHDEHEEDEGRNVQQRPAPDGVGVTRHDRRADDQRKDRPHPVATARRNRGRRTRTRVGSATAIDFLGRSLIADAPIGRRRSWLTQTLLASGAAPAGVCLASDPYPGTRRTCGLAVWCWGVVSRFASVQRGSVGSASPGYARSCSNSILRARLTA